ncbi:MAG: DEAD/DEAH box helicase [Terriglobales bacterium]
MASARSISTAASWRAMFHPLVAAWFEQRFGEPTEPQLAGWPLIAGGGDVLLAAPTGSGKTLAAFLVAIDRIFRQAVAGRLREETEIVYLSPLKALANDVQKNLEEPLAEICRYALEQGHLLPEMRAAVRTGDTLAAERLTQTRRPPHILVTTPESLYLLLTAEGGRRMLATARTAIVDEIHAVAGNKRGAHLALSLERLQALCGRRLQRIGLSATVKPLAEVGRFLAGGAPAPEVVAIPRRRALQLQVEAPRRSELGPIATNDQWAERYDRLAELAKEQRSILIFVTTRALAERIAHHLRARLGEELVAAHHGSLSRKIRLRAEERFKRGALKAMVATASLELGLDIGSVDLVCQIGSPRVMAAAWQRIGRAGHWKGATPKGRFFALTRDDLIECAALVEAMNRAVREGDEAGALDLLAVPAWPRDILAQQIVATAATGDWSEDDLFALCRRAHPYRDLPRGEFDAVVRMLSEGISHRRGRAGAFLHRYAEPAPAAAGGGPRALRYRLRARRGARLAALTSGGAIAENAAYQVVAEPENMPIGTLDEDFAIESNAGDVILLGTTSWMIRGVETGRVRVENAHGAPPTVPFWKGEAPGRTLEFSRLVAEFRRALAERAQAAVSEAERGALRAWLAAECGLDENAAAQAIAYAAAGAAELGGAPTAEEIVAERFFDEGGGMQLVIHAPFGSRINKAWGMALRKRFCRGFDFELQAAASENGLVLSLSEQHSFPLETIFEFLNARTAAPILTQAVLQAPLFQTRWRWTAGRALALLRFTGGRKVPPQIQRMRAEDLLAAAFPQAVGCQDNHGGGDLEVPDHPLVAEAMRDCLQEALDLPGLESVLAGMEAGRIRCRAVDRPSPSLFSHEILNSAPYSYLDDAPLEERRARAVNLRRTQGAEGSGAGALDAAAIAAVREEAWPRPESADELHDLLLSLTWLPAAAVPEGWAGWVEALRLAGRVVAARAGGATGWMPIERAVAEGVIVPEDEAACAAIARGWMEILGPTTAAALAARLGWPAAAIENALLALEGDGLVLRGHFTREAGGELEWCDRRLLARIHRRTVAGLRAAIEPVSPAVLLRFLLRWQHLEPETRLHGAAGLAIVLDQLQGYEAAASDWERRILPARLAGYDPAHLDRLCFAGEFAWARLAPPAANGTGRRRAARPTAQAPIAFFRREAAGWLLAGAVREETPLSRPAQLVLGALERHGALFFSDLARLAGAREEKLVASQIEEALWELAAAARVTADGFDNLRALLDPKRRRGEGNGRLARPRQAAGRWTTLAALHGPANGDAHEGDAEAARRAWAERHAQQLLRRYGVLLRALMERESPPLAWYELLLACRRLEARGEIRGGRFVSGFAGEQYALPEAVEALRAARKLPPLARPLRVAASDPLNLVGILTPGERVPAQGGHSVEIGSELIAHSS